MQVGIARCHTAGGGHELMEGGVDAAGDLGNGMRQRFDVGVVELGDLSVVEDVLNDGMQAHERLEDLLIGLILASGGLPGLVGEFEALKEHFAHLFRAVEVEGATCGLVDALLQFGGFLVELDAVLAQGLHVDFHTEILHAGEHGDQR